MDDNMLKKNIIPDSAYKIIAVLCAIAGSIIAFILWDWSEFYADFEFPDGDLGIFIIVFFVLYLILYLIPIVLCLIIGGGLGVICGCGVTLVVDNILTVIVTYIKQKVAEFRHWREEKRANKRIKKSNKSINEDVNQLRTLKSQLNIRQHTIPSYNLCCLVDSVVVDKIGFKPCLDFSTEQYNILTQIETIKDKIKKLAEQYKVVNDTKSADYYYNIVNDK